MFVMYVFGSYYKLYGNKERLNTKNLMISMLCLFVMILSVIIIVILAYALKSKFILSLNPLSSYSNIVSFGFSYFLFVYFANKKFVFKTINVISSTTVSIYLLHDNSLIYQMIWLKWFPNIDYVNNPFIHSILKIISVFIVCMLIDLLRQNTIGKIFKKYVYPRIYKTIDLINNKIDMNKILSKF